MDKSIITCHGFTGYPEEMELIGKFFEEKGYIWYNLTLPGHGATPEQLKETKWVDWINYLEQEINTKSHDYDVYLCGLSLGGILTLWSLENISKIKAAAILSTPINIVPWYAKFLFKLPIKFWIHKGDKEDEADILDPEARKGHRSYRKYHTDSAKQINFLLNDVTENFDKIDQPLLIIHSKKDEKANYRDAQLIYDAVSSQQKDKFLVENSGHMIAKDYDKEVVFDKIYQFFEDI